MTRGAADDLAIAFHEAGHAVMAWALGRIIHEVTIEPRPDLFIEEGKGVVLGYSAHTMRAKSLHTKFDPAECDNAEKEVMIVMAGPLAMGLHLGRAIRPTHEDRRMIDSLVRNYHRGFVFASSPVDFDWKDEEAAIADCRRTFTLWLKARTRVHLLVYWPRVDALADALVEKRTLSGAAVRRLLGRKPRQP